MKFKPFANWIRSETFFCDDGDIGEKGSDDGEGVNSEDDGDWNA